VKFELFERCHVRGIFLLFLSITLVLICSAPLYAVGFSWIGNPISGEAGQEYPNFYPSGNANFEIISGTELLLTLTYAGSSEPLSSINQVLTGLTWDMNGYTGQLTADSALVAQGSNVIGANSSSFSGSDLSGQWTFKDDISVSSSPIGPLGMYGVGAVGDIDFGEDTFGSSDVIDAGKTQISPVPGGIDFGLVPFGPLPSNGGFQNQGPVVMNTVEFGFTFDGTLTEDMFTNVQPLFGSDGATPVPEPATILLLGTALIGLAGIGRKRINKK
jgi:hypothetical protein